MRGSVNEKDAAAASSTIYTPVASTTSDVSIPYDSAARLAYDEWREANKKGAFDEAKFQKFKASYDKITSANMAAKKTARDSDSKPKLQSIPSNADA